MLSAAGTGAASGAWGETYGYDGFGNLLTKTPSGSPPTLSQAVNPANNQVVGSSYDANGNQLTLPNFSGSAGYDVENRLAAAPGVQYGYDSENKRVWAGVLDGSGNVTSQVANLYGTDGQKLGSYALNVSYGSGIPTEFADPPANLMVYFAGKRIGVTNQVGQMTAFMQDRLGSNAASNVSLWPWGEDRGTPAPNDQVKFATYTRDSATLLDYAAQRYYANVAGRFMTPDPYQPSGGPSDPGSWNRYAYTRGDPVNRLDPRGTDDISAPYLCPVGPAGTEGGQELVECFDVTVSLNPATAMQQANGAAAAAQAMAAAVALANTIARMKAAVAVAIKALNNPDCANLFKLDKNAPDPAILLSQIANGFDPQVYFTETWLNPDRKTPNLYTNAVTMLTSWSLQNGDLVNTGTAMNLAVAFNFNPNAPFNTGSVSDNAVTVLHELGHIYEFLYGLGSTMLVDDSGNSQASAFNTKLVQANCFPARK